MAPGYQSAQDARGRQGLSLKTFLVVLQDILELMVLSTACAQYLKPPQKKEHHKKLVITRARLKTRDLVDSVVERC